jgi:hypothetical protein
MKMGERIDKPPLGLLHRRNPDVDLPLQQVQWHGASLKDPIVVFPHREPVAESRPRFLAEFDDLQFANHVGAGLSRINSVAFYFARLDAVVNTLLTGPALGVNAGVNDQAACAEEF